LFDVDVDALVASRLCWLPKALGIVAEQSETGEEAVDSLTEGHRELPGRRKKLVHFSLSEFEKSSKGVRSRPDIRFISFGVAEFGTLGGHATAFLTELAKQATASKGMHVGKFLASWRRKVSLAIHVAHAENALRGLYAAADGVEAASSSAGMPYPATALFTRAMGRKRPRASSSGA
jgi:hypothetical protein